MQVERGNVKAPPTVEEVYQGVAAPSRLKVDDAAAVTEMPKVSYLNTCTATWQAMSAVQESSGAIDVPELLRRWVQDVRVSSSAHSLPLIYATANDALSFCHAGCWRVHEFALFPHDRYVQNAVAGDQAHG